VRIPVVTALIIVVNAIVFGMELVHGEPFVVQWAAIPAQIVSGHRWSTMLTAMFMHASWSHIIGNMVFLWAFGPEVEDAMGRGRYLVFYLTGGLVACWRRLLPIHVPRCRIWVPAERLPR
jgi:membrane associated rhomboid family serine protease